MLNLRLHLAFWVTVGMPALSLDLNVFFVGNRQYRYQFEELSDEMRSRIQSTVWDVVSVHPYAGVLRDRDVNGIDDEWEWQHFGGAGKASPGNDADDDGMTNGEEYLAGTDPNNPESILRVKMVVETNAPRLVWPRAADRRYDVEWSPTLTGATFAPLISNLPWSQQDHGMNEPDFSGYYRIRVRIDTEHP